MGGGGYVLIQVSRRCVSLCVFVVRLIYKVERGASLWHLCLH